MSNSNEGDKPKKVFIIHPNTVLAFGKYKGNAAYTVPLRYLIWLNSLEGYRISPKLFSQVFNTLSVNTLPFHTEEI